MDRLPQKTQPKDQKMSQEGREIIFRPLTEGLGFHPFSDGLPYAPVAKNPRSTAILPPPVSQSSNLDSGAVGAVAAGPPRFLPPLGRPSQVPRVSVPVVGHSAPLHGTARDALIPPVGRFTSAYGWSYLAKRMTAYCMDFMLNSVFFLSILAFLILRQESNLDIFSNGNVILVTGLFWLCFHWFLTTLQEVTFGTSLGKKFLRFSLKGSGGILLLRAVLFIPSIAFLGVGVLWSLVDHRRRCWHDLVTGEQPVESR